MKLVGFALVMLGIFTLAYGTIGYDRHRTMVDLGSFKATAVEHRQDPLSPIAGAVLLAGGLVLMVWPRRRPAL
jgi:hypothetical protein